MEKLKILYNIKVLKNRLNINPIKFLEKKIKDRLDVSLIDYYAKLNKYYDYISEKIEEDVLKTAKKLFKGK